MAEIILRYDGRNVVIQHLIKALVAAGAEIKDYDGINARRRKSGMEKAEDDIKAGRVYSAESVDDMINKILG